MTPVTIELDPQTARSLAEHAAVLGLTVSILSLGGCETATIRMLMFLVPEVLCNRSELAAENLALRQQLAFLIRSRKCRACAIEIESFWSGFRGSGRIAVWPFLSCVPRRCWIASIGLQAVLAMVAIGQGCVCRPVHPGRELIMECVLDASIPVGVHQLD
jgi:hypothetical protein